MGGEAQPAREEADANTDARVFGAVLVGAKAPIPASLLARSLSWTLPRLAAAADQLDRQAHPLGMQTTRTMSGIRLAARAGILDETTAQRVLDAQASQPTALRTTQLRILTAVAARSYKERDTNDERVQLAALVNRGLVEHQRGEWTVTDRVARSIWPQRTPPR